MKDKIVEILKKYQTRDSIFGDKKFIWADDFDSIASDLSALKALEGEEVISEWIRFEDKLPLEGQEIMLTWPSGNYHPEYRKVTNEMLKGNCSLLRWIPIPKY